MHKLFVTAVLSAMAALLVITTTGASDSGKGVARITPLQSEAESAATTYQGKDIRWWASHAVANRIEANLAKREIKRLRAIQYRSLSVEESILLATTAYPQMSQAVAWCIIRHESWMVPDPLHARNPTAIGSEHATGLYQFLPSTFRSTPYGRFDIYSPYVQSMAAGWMFAHNRAREWTNGCT